MQSRIWTETLSKNVNPDQTKGLHCSSLIQQFLDIWTDSQIDLNA